MLHKNKWLVFFYSVPTMPVNNRVKIWRRLTRSGALQIKNSVYVLPYSDAHYEFFQWLLCEVTAINGDGEFVRVERFETLKDSDLIDMFNRQRDKDYEGIATKLEMLERDLNGIRMTSPEKVARKLRKLLDQTNKLSEEFEGIRKIDFFSATGAVNLREKILAIKAEITGYAGSDAQGQGPPPLLPRRMDDYQLRVWVTRQRPFVDRLSSAWLIKRFIDASAVFRFVDNEALDGIDKDAVTFDISGGDFTHVGQLCTFEVIIKAFGLKDAALNRIAEIVHDIDTNDNRYDNPETKGIEGILIGLSRTARDDMEALQMAMALFEMLYASKRHI
ncbi:MAG: chromate resistance protein [Nitrospirae bacterium]|nr:chromate resistance protein [Nitrospirota bacterium]MBF0593028.1 chromate resistance protein [Nitrospirota bacterium]